MTSNRTALITGAASGIGLATARRLVARGDSVILVDRSDSVHAVARDLATQAAQVFAYKIDLGAHDALRKSLAEIKGKHPVIDIVINSAGINPKNEGGKFLTEQIDLDQWNQVLAVNVTAPLIICSALLPDMKKRGWGRIVNIGSSAGRNRPSSASAHYVSSKAALAGLTRCIAEEGAAHGITANTLSPGPTITGLTGGSSPEATAARAATIPMGRYANADEIAAVAEFLSSEGASFMTGTVVDVNGGRQMN